MLCERLVCQLPWRVFPWNDGGVQEERRGLHSEGGAERRVPSLPPGQAKHSFSTAFSPHPQAVAGLRALALAF
eukprot:3808990-Rhodomonas_salina.1